MPQLTITPAREQLVGNRARRQHGVEQQREGPPDHGCDDRDDDGLQHDAAEQRARPRADRLEHAVETDAFDGEEREEQRDDHDRDHEGDADDLVEHRTLLAFTPPIGVGSVALGHGLGRAVGRAVDGRRYRPGSRSVRTTSAWNTPGATADAGPIRVLHVRQVGAEAHSEPAPE